PQQAVPRRARIPVPHRREVRMTLSILDLSPIVSGATAGDALRNTIDLARRAEGFGYHRYWLAEHHFAPGVASSAPAVLIALVAAATSTIRVGSGAVQLGYQTPVAVVDQFGIIDALYPGRVDLGLRRSGQRCAAPGVASSARAALIALVAAAASSIRVGSGAVQLGYQTPVAVVEQFGIIDALYPGRVDLGLGRSGQRRAELASGRGADKTGNTQDTSAEQPRARIVDGLLIPPPFDWSRLAQDPRLAFQASLLQQPGAQTPDFAEQVDDVLAFLNGTHRAHAVPGEGADVQVWILGSSGGQSARVAGERGLPFAANYHVAPSNVLEAVEAYRKAFKPSKTLAEPYVVVSADVVVADDEAKARELAAGYDLWVRSIRTGAGAMPYPTPAEAAAHVWTRSEGRRVGKGGSRR